eukprot:1683584-Rhodomonas_salina.3
MIPTDLRAVTRQPLPRHSRRAWCIGMRTQVVNASCKLVEPTRLPGTVCSRGCCSRREVNCCTRPNGAGDTVRQSRSTAARTNLGGASVTSQVTSQLSTDGRGGRQVAGGDHTDGRLRHGARPTLLIAVQGKRSPHALCVSDKWLLTTSHGYDMSRAGRKAFTSYEGVSNCDKICETACSASCYLPQE